MTRDLIDVMRAKLKNEKELILEVEKSNLTFSSANGFSDPNLDNLNEESMQKIEVLKLVIRHLRDKRP